MLLHFNVLLDLTEHQIVSDIQTHKEVHEKKTWSESFADLKNFTCLFNVGFVRNKKIDIHTKVFHSSCASEM